MKILLFSLVLLFFLLLQFHSPAEAQENWKIDSFHSDIQIQSDGFVSIVETIAVDFGSLQKHGIFRNIPYIYQNKDGSKTYLEFEIGSITRNDNNERYSRTASGNEVVLKIGDPNETITGTQSYKIQYLVKGNLLGYEEFDELYWNVTGNNWVVEIEKASANITIPKEGVLQKACYQGVNGSEEDCSESEITPTEFLFESTRVLDTGEGMTVALGYKKGSVPLLIAEPPKTVWSDIKNPINLSIALGAFLIGVFLIIRLWLRKGRDFWFGRNYLLGSKSGVSPIGARETVVVEYSPPEKLRPAELTALIDEKADTLDVTATIVDLASRGCLTITEEPKTWALGSSDYIFERSEKKVEGLLEYEEELLLRLFDDGNSVKMSELKNKFYKDLAVVKEKLYLDLADKKFFVENPSKVRLRYSLFAVLIGGVGGGVLWLSVLIVSSLLFELSLVVVSLAILFLVTAQFMPARTALGRQLFVRAQGYKLFIETAEKYRQQFFEKKNLFNEILPYAIVFGLTGKFAKAFEKMGIEPQQPSWYHSPNAFNVIVFSSAMNSFSTTVSNSIASAPSSSGSGGGGSSGGGFGGGGGGSW